MIIQQVRDKEGKLIGYRCSECGKTKKVTNLNGVCQECQRENNIKMWGSPKVDKQK